MAITATEQLENHLRSLSGLSPAAFELSLPHWQLQHYKKGEFYNGYKNVCKHLGFVINGVFRIYKFEEKSQSERNMIFFTPGHLMSSLRSFLNQTACEYFTEAMTEADVLYIHYDQLQHLYKTSHEWERFGRLYSERALDMVMHNTEGFLFRTPEERYAELIQQQPDIHNNVPLYHIASFLGIEGPSLSRIRKRMQHAQ